MTAGPGRLAGRIAVVTGASRGFGRAVAVELAREGAHVICVARTVGGLEETDDLIRAAGGQATLVPLDLRDFDKIDQLGATLYGRYGRTDILVGNAATMGALQPLAQAKPAEWQQVFDLNVTANYRLIRIFDPLLRASDAGRAVFVTTGLARVDRPYFGPYAASKAALERMAQDYAREVEITPVRVNLFDPGILRTRMRAAAYPGEDPLTVQTPESVAPALAALCLPAETRNGTIITL